MVSQYFCESRILSFRTLGVSEIQKIDGNYHFFSDTCIRESVSVVTCLSFW